MKNNLFNLISFVGGDCVLNKNCIFCDSKLSSIIELASNNCADIDFICENCHSFSITIERDPSTKTAELTNLFIKCFVDGISIRISIYNSCYFLYRASSGLAPITQNISKILEYINLISLTAEDCQKLIKKLKKMSYYE